MEEYILRQKDIDALGLQGVMEGEPATEGEIGQLIELGMLPSDIRPAPSPTKTLSDQAGNQAEPILNVENFLPSDVPVDQQMTKPLVAAAANQPANPSPQATPIANTGVTAVLGRAPQKNALTSLMTSRSDEQTDPYGSMSDTQRRMLAFAAISDAGRALQGKEGTMVTSLLSDFTERADQQRKAEAARQRREMLGTLGIGSSNIRDTSPQGLEAQRQIVIQAMATGDIDPTAGTAMLADIDRLLAAGGQVTTNIQGISAVEALLDSPDLEQITGFSGVANSYLEKLGLAPKYSNLMSYVAMLEGINFLEAYQGLKGGGAISNFEADKAAAAKSRFMRALKAGPEELKTALEDVKDLFQEAVEKNPTYKPELMSDGKLSEDDLKYIFNE
jgi:hypothetical protein